MHFKPWLMPSGNKTRTQDAPAKVRPGTLARMYAKAKKKEEGKKKAKKEGASRKRKGFIPAFSPINRFLVLDSLVDIPFEIDLD